MRMAKNLFANSSQSHTTPPYHNPRLHLRAIAIPTSTMGPLKIVLLAVAMAAVVVLSFFVHYQSRHMPSPFVKHGGKIAIIVSNQQEVGDDMDLADSNMHLLCHGYSEHNRSHSLWSARATIPGGEEARLTLPAVKGDEAFEVLCTYRGANRCWAHGVRVFSNPGHDNLFCAERVGGCTVRFRKDGGVEKQYDPVAVTAARRDVQPPMFLGFVPDFDNARDSACTSASCIGRKLNRVIGQESCCDDSCGSWEKATPNISSM